MKEAGPRAMACPALVPLAAPHPMAGVLGGVDATRRVDYRGEGGPQLASAPHSSTWGSSMQFLGGTRCPVSKGSHPGASREVWVGGLQWGSSGPVRVPGPQGSALSGRCCQPWWSGPCWPSGVSGGSVKIGRECGQAGPAGRRGGVLATRQPQPWP